MSFPQRLALAWGFFYFIRFRLVWEMEDQFIRFPVKKSRICLRCDSCDIGPPRCPDGGVPTSDPRARRTLVAPLVLLLDACHL